MVSHKPHELKSEVQLFHSLSRKIKINEAFFKLYERQAHIDVIRRYASCHRMIEIAERIVELNLKREKLGVVR